MKLGTKVKCTGYLKKVKTKHVEFESDRKKYRTTEDLIEEFESMAFSGVIDSSERSNFLAIHEVIFIDDSCEQLHKELKCIDFEGVVVAKKSIATKRSYEIVENEYAFKIESGIKVTHCNYIDCYQVFFRMGGSRLVPVEMCEVEL